MRTKTLAFLAAILCAQCGPGVNTLQAATQQMMRQVVIANGSSAYEAEQDAISQARSISGGRYRTISMSTNYRPASRSFETRLVIEF